MVTWTRKLAPHKLLVLSRRKISDPFLAISEDFNLKFSRESMPPDPLVGSRSRFCISPHPPSPTWKSAYRALMVDSSADSMFSSAAGISSLSSILKLHEKIWCSQ